MNLPQIDQILTRAIAEMAGHELETINRLEEGDVIRFPGHGIPADELSELEGLLKKKPSAETTQPSKPEKKAPEGPLPKQATSEKPKTVKNAQKPGRLTSLNKGQTVMIHQGGKRKDWYMERTTAGTYVAVAGAKMQRSKTLEGALRWLWKQSQGGMQRQITKVFDLDAIKAGNAPPEEKPMGSLTPKTPEPKPTPTKLGSGESATILKNIVIGAIGTKAKKMLQNGWIIEVYDAKSPYAKEALGPLPKSEVDTLRKKGLMLVTSQSSMTPPEIKLKHIVSDALGRKGRKLLISGWKIAEYTGGKPSNLVMSQVLTGLVLVPTIPKTKDHPMGSLTPKVTPPPKSENVAYTEKQLFDHLKTLRAPNITVFQLQSMFGGTPQQHTRWLQKRVKEGKLNVRREPGIKFAIYSLAEDPKQSKQKLAIFDAVAKLAQEIDALDAFYRDIEYDLDMKGSGTGTEVQELRNKINAKHGIRWSAQQAYLLIRDMTHDIEKAIGKDIPIKKPPKTKLKGRTDADLFMAIQQLATKKAKSIRAAKDAAENAFSGPISDEVNAWWRQVIAVGEKAENKAREMDFLARQMRAYRKELASKKALSEPNEPTPRAGADEMPAAKDVAKFAAQIQYAVNRLTDSYSKKFSRTIRVTKRRKFYAVDVDGSGWLLVAPGGNIVGIKGYGVPHYGKQYGNIYDFIKKGGKLHYSTFTANLKPYTATMAKEYK
jgi:hypothetical protein